MGGFSTYQIELTRGYGRAEFREDIKKMARAAGVEGRPLVFLLPDSKIVDEGFLEDVNNLLNSGEVRDAHHLITPPRTPIPEEV
jgi:dynein heavy chain